MFSRRRQPAQRTWACCDSTPPNPTKRIQAPMATRPQHGRGRLAAARELRNRQVDEAHEAFHRMQVAVASFDDSMQMRVAEGDERPLKEVEAAVQECMAKVRVLPLKPKLVGAHYRRNERMRGLACVLCVQAQA